jgi:hypothetical protein
LEKKQPLQQKKLKELTTCRRLKLDPMFHPVQKSTPPRSKILSMETTAGKNRENSERYRHRLLFSE